MRELSFGVAALLVVSCAAASAVEVTVDWATETGPVKPVNAVGQPPLQGGPRNFTLMHYLKEAGIPYSRLHDVGDWLGSGLWVDIPNLFPDFDADENDPANYAFDMTDALLKALVANGVEPYFRLGVTIENFAEWGFSPRRIAPPKDFAKWARICEHVIRHYTEGWANGLRLKITYWEIWNEPENNPDPARNPMWQAPFADYVRFYGVVATHLKAKFPHLKIGGYGHCGFYAGVGSDHVPAANSSPRMEHFVDCSHQFLKTVKANGWPLDFFSFHSYSAPREALRQVRFADEHLSAYGFTREKTERHFNEWLPYVGHANLGGARQAAGVAAELIGLQNGPCDLACIYDARCGVGDYSPLFDPLTYRPHKAYYAYTAFNELRRRGKAVKASTDDADVWVAAAKDAAGGAVMVANDSDREVALQWHAGRARLRGGRITDATRTDASFDGVLERIPPRAFAVLFADFGSRPVGLKVNHLVEPGHVDGTPVFSWRMAADRPGARQTAYRLKVEDVWDSGVVEDGKSVGIALAGRPLESARRYRWTVAVRDETGAWSESEPATFSTGVLKDGDWGGAQWISPATAAPHGYRTALFRRAFGVTKSVSEAWWTVTGAGVFVPSVNGGPVTDEALLPGATHALKVRQACTYDVTDLLRKAQGATNVLGATVSTGWSRDRIAARNRSGRGLDPSQPGAFKAVLVLRYGDGSEERLATDESWQATEGGPLVAAGIYEGEEFDARQSVDWAGADWPAARLNADFAGVVRNFRGPPVSLRRDLALKPIAASVVNGATGAGEKSFGTAQVRRRFADGEPMTLAPGEQLVVDFGQNASAVPEFVLSAAAGTKVEVRHAEMLNEGRGEKARGNDGPAGTPYLSNLRTSFAGIRYTCRGGDRESYRPAFTFFGYRYIGVTADRPLTIWRVTSVPVTSVPQGYDTGTLETDNPRINRLLANCRWGMYSNYLSVPTDCPQRDERVGWTADTQVFTPAATYLADVSAFLSKWMADMRDCQRADGCFSQIAPENAVRGAVTGWTDAGVIVPYVLWRRSGDAAVVRENWSAMVRYLDYVEKRGAQDAQPYGDWLSYEYGADMEWLKPVREQRQLPRKRVLNAAYRVWIGRMMAEMAEAIGETAAVSKYRAFAERETERFRGTCLKPDGTLLAECDGQCSGLFALYLKLLPDAAAVEATKRDLRENFRRNGDCLRTGFLGTSILLDAVTEGLGDLNLAYTLLLQDKNPSWLYSVDQGATTIWERWNSYTKSDGFGPVSMNSFNHYAYGAVAGWMFSTMAGIRAEEPGFRKIRFAPKPDKRIGRVSAAFDSPYGRIRSSWRHEGSRVVWEGEVPPNATAVLESPDGSVRNLESGSHRAEWSVQPAARNAEADALCGPYERLRYNSQGTCDLKVGLWAFPLPMDYDGDGIDDMVVHCPDTPWRGTFFFAGTARGVFKAPVRIDGQQFWNLSSSIVDGEPVVLAAKETYWDFRRNGFGKNEYCDQKLSRTFKWREGMWRFADLDGDGRSDRVCFTGRTAYWERCLSPNGPDATYAAAVRLVDGKERPLEGLDVLCDLADLDGDGDFDILYPRHPDGFQWRENVGTKTSPRFAPARTLRSTTGADLAVFICMNVPCGWDLDRDGRVDILSGDEDGRVLYFRNSGRRDADGSPTFEPYRALRQQRADLTEGVLVAPSACDWDGDGDTDLICGDSAGCLTFIENLSGAGVERPSWAEPVRLSCEGAGGIPADHAANNPIRLMAGLTGSVQGPGEAKWGYTSPTVVDWDGDGLLDVVNNSVWGYVYWHRNIGTRTAPKLGPATPIEVEWTEPQPELAWGVNKPKGKELMTQWRTTPVTDDWDGDGLPDLIMLDPEGYLALYRRVIRDGRRALLPPERVFIDEDTGAALRSNDKAAGQSGRRKLCVMDWDGDGKKDFFISSPLYHQFKRGVSVDWWQQTKAADGRWHFVNRGRLSPSRLHGHSCAPTPVDFNGDGIPDIVIGAEDGCFYYLRNPRTK